VTSSVKGHHIFLTTQRAITNHKDFSKIEITGKFWFYSLFLSNWYILESVSCPFWILVLYRIF